MCDMCESEAAGLADYSTDVCRIANALHKKHERIKQQNATADTLLGLLSEYRNTHISGGTKCTTFYHCPLCTRTDHQLQILCICRSHTSDRLLLEISDKCPIHGKLH